MKRLVIFVVGVLAMLTFGSCNPTNAGTEPEKKVPSIVGMWTCSEIVLTQGDMTITLPVAMLEECIVFSFNEDGTGGIGVYEEEEYLEEVAFTSYELNEDGTITIVSYMGGEDGNEQIVGRYILDGEDTMILELPSADEEYELVTLSLLKGLHPEVLTPKDEYEQLPEPSPTDPVKNSLWLVTAYGMTNQGSEIKIPTDMANGGNILELHFGNDGTGEVCTIAEVDGEKLHEKTPFTYTYTPEDGMIQLVDANLDQAMFRVVREENSMRLIAKVDNEYLILYLEFIEKCSAE